jgi:Spy/CpxP family protein refolding chaperone
MRIKFGVALLTLVSAVGFAQSTMPAPPPPGPGAPGDKHIIMFKRELGAWWKNSDVAQKLNLTDSQIKQLEDTFYQHRLKLVDIGAEMQKSDMKLQQMLDADTVDESAVNAQVDQVLAARGKMEREFTNMNLNFRKILTGDQWKQLRSLQGPPMHDRIFMRQRGPEGPGEHGFSTGGGPGPGPQSELEEEGLPMPEGEGADCTSSEKNGMKIVQCTKTITVTTDMENEL